MGIYVVNDFGDLGEKLNQIQSIRNQRIKDGNIASDIVVIDATPKASASKRKTQMYYPAGLRGKESIAIQGEHGQFGRVGQDRYKTSRISRNASDSNNQIFPNTNGREVLIWPRGNVLVRH